MVAIISDDRDDNDINDSKIDNVNINQAMLWLC